MHMVLLLVALLRRQQLEVITVQTADTATKELATIVFRVLHSMRSGLVRIRQ